MSTGFASITSGGEAAQFTSHSKIRQAAWMSPRIVRPGQALGFSYDALDLEADELRHAGLDSFRPLHQFSRDQHGLEIKRARIFKTPTPTFAHV